MRYLDHLFRDSRFVELRHLPSGSSSWHETPQSLIETAKNWVSDGNLFTSLNHVPELPRKPVTNNHIDRVTRLFFDFDPIRPPGTSSTEVELGFARVSAQALSRSLRKIGWPEPLQAMSGNGWHLQYRIAAPNTSEFRDIVSSLYRGLGGGYGSHVVSFDEVVRNPGRICTLYGTTKRKGRPTVDRPHRQSRCWTPDKWEQVTVGQIEALANVYSKQIRHQARSRPRQQANLTSGAGDYASLDIVSWFKSHNLYENPIGGIKHAVKCPWQSEHAGSNRNDTLIFESDGGWPGFFCHHSHCEDRRINDVIVLMRDADVFCTRRWGSR